MLSKFSVRRPFSVIVGIVLVFILGVVSFTDMTTDLLPNINLPYTLVLTTYQGASPEKVETVVSKPLEQSMATVSNIKNIQSISADNYSMIICEFEQTTDMDSVSIEMREKLDQVSGYWQDDQIGKPSIMKLNPNMMPIMITAVEKEGVEGAALTDYVDENLTDDLESLEGVASVDKSGDIEESIQVLLNEDKINATNQRVQDALNGKFETAEEALSSAQSQIESGQAGLESGQEQLIAGLSQSSDAEAQLLTGEAQIDAGLNQLRAAQTELNQQYGDLKNQIDLLKTADLLKNSIYEQAYEAAKSDAYQAAIANLPDGASEEMIAAAKAAIDQTFDTTYLETLEEALKQVTNGQLQLKAQIEQLETTKSNLQAGKISLVQAQGEINAAQIDATIEMASGKASLDVAEQQLETNQQTLADQKEAALAQANMTHVITNDMIKGILVAENFSMPAGYITEEGTDYLVQVGDAYTDPDSLENLVIMDMGIDGLEPITLSDVADIAVTNDADEVYASMNGKPAIVLSIQKQTGYSTGDVSNRILEYFDQAEIDQQGLTATPLLDQGIYIKMIINSVLQNIGLGGILAILVLLLFLRDLKPTIVVAFSIPVSLLVAIILMYFSGITLNIISLSGLALGVGMLVDNSIVVIENIYRLRSQNVPVRTAAVLGAKQVTGAIMASTLTTVCVFAPIVFAHGITRELFVDMGLTIAFSLIASLMTALTIVPMMSAGLLKKEVVQTHPFFERLKGYYGKALAKILDHKVIVLPVVVLLLIASTFLAIASGTSFMPDMEGNSASITATMPENYTVQQTGVIADEMIARLNAIEDVESVGAIGGSSGSAFSMGEFGSSSANTANLYLNLVTPRKMSNTELEDAIKEKLNDLDCDLNISTSNMDLSALGGSGITIQIKGKDLDELQTLAKNIGEKIQSVDKIENIQDGLEDSTPELRISIDKDKAMAHGMTVAQVYQQVASKIADPSRATDLSTDEKDYTVMVLNSAKDSYTREDIKTMIIQTTNPATQETEDMPLEQLATFSEGVSPQNILRDNQSRYISVTADLKSGENIGLAADEVEESLEDFEMPTGYSFEITGEDETVNDAMGELIKMAILAIVLMYLIMVAQFQSLLSPFIVMFTIPLAFTGGFLALLIARMDVSVIAAVGLIMLAGIIINNGIVLVDYINQLQIEGLSKREAIIEGGKTRLRPILMTATTTILALSTMALGFGSGADMIQPMAVVTIGGLVYGTLLTLFVVPCIYELLNRRKFGEVATAVIQEERIQDKLNPEIFLEEPESLEAESLKKQENDLADGQKNEKQ